MDERAVAPRRDRRDDDRAAVAGAEPVQRPRWGMLRGHLVFLAVWVLFPSAFRVATFARLAGVDLPGWSLSAWQGLGLGLVQDLALATELVLLGLLLRRGLRLRAGACAAITAALFVIVHSYLLLDFLFHWETQLRLSFRFFFEFIDDAPALMTSASELGVWRLWVGLAGVVVAGVCYWRFVPRPPEISVNRLFVLASVLVLALALLLTLGADRRLRYAAGNVFYREQAAALDALFGGGPATRVFDRATVSSEFSWFSRGELYEPTRAGYPLLKHTRGFRGDRLFNIRIDGDERPHVIFLFLESFRTKDVGVLGGSFGATPRFDGLAAEGVLFPQFYANGVQTTRALLASLFGVYPRFTLSAVQSDNVRLPMISVADQFLGRGYETAYFHNGPIDFEDMGEFVWRHGFREIHGPERVAEGAGDEQVGWGLTDERLMRYTAEWLAGMQRQSKPAFATVFTMTHHHPWLVPPGYRAPTPDIPGNPEYTAFLETLHYSDHCLGLFVDLLEEKGLAEDTILFILADTAQPMGERGGSFMLADHLFEEYVRVPLLILAPGRIGAPARIESVSSQVDLLPTVLDVFGMTGENHAVGTSLAREVPERVAYFNNPFGLGLQGLRQGRYKYVCSREDERLEQLYDLDEDPLERSNIAAEHPELTRRYRQMVDGVDELFRWAYQAERLAPPRVVARSLER